MKSDLAPTDQQIPQDRFAEAGHGTDSCTAPVMNGRATTLDYEEFGEGGLHTARMGPGLRPDSRTEGNEVLMQLAESNRQESRWISLIRTCLTQVGAISSRKTLDKLDYWLERVMSQLEAGSWFRAHGFPIKPSYSCRRELYAAVARSVAHEQVLYLEFGVFQGASMRMWSELLTHPRSSLHGFDSFEGLPEHWNALHPQGTFDTNGNIPTFDDPRVQLHIGWFDQILPTFALPAHDRLILHIDVDVYSSAKFVLETLQNEIGVGTIILFDEFYDGKHELKAFDEFLASTNMKFRFLGNASSLSQCAFERVE